MQMLNELNETLSDTHCSEQAANTVWAKLAPVCRPVNEFIAAIKNEYSMICLPIFQT